MRPCPSRSTLPAHPNKQSKQNEEWEGRVGHESLVQPASLLLELMMVNLPESQVYVKVYVINTSIS